MPLEVDAEGKPTVGSWVGPVGFTVFTHALREPQERCHLFGRHLLLVGLRLRRQPVQDVAARTLQRMNRGLFIESGDFRVAAPAGAVDDGIGPGRVAVRTHAFGQLCPYLDRSWFRFTYRPPTTAGERGGGSERNDS